MSDYAAIVRCILDEYADFVPPEEDIEVEKVYDEARGHYELLFLGWRRSGVFMVVFCT
jgi:hypothetical protein